MDTKRRKIIMKILLILIYLILTVSGLVFMKLGGNAGTLALKEGTITFGINWISAIGFICYICSFLLFTRIVIMYDLSYIMPIVTGVVQILTLASAFIIFKEKMSIQGIIGAVIIIAGIIIMNFKKA